MLKKITQSEWTRCFTETLTLVLVLGIVGGIILGFARGWKYLPRELFLPLLDTLNLSINESLFIAFIFLFLFLFIFLSLNYLIRNIKLACFIASALSCIPFFLLWGYRINKANRIPWPDFFEREAIVLNLKIGLIFLLLWILVSIGLFFWTKSRILNTQKFNVRLLSSLLAVVLIFNISIYIFYNFHKIEHDSSNVIILLVDCLSANHLSSYGYVRNTTPNIDEFSKDAVIFTQAISQSTFTKTSIASLFTSLYPYQHGVYRGAGESRDVKGNITTDVLSEEETTLAQVLQQNGFFTTAWIHQGQLSSFMGFAKGFIDYNERQGNIENINKNFLHWAERIGKKRKFFAYIHYLDLHSPYRPKPPYDTLYLDETLKNERTRGSMKAYYDGLITYIDNEIGLLLEDLKEEGLYDNSLIILTADHGDAFRKNNNSGHAKAPYEEVIKVPLIIKFPKSLYAGRIIKSQVRSIDIMPTILDFFQVKTDEKLSGFSLMHYLDNKNNHKASFPKYAISEIYNKGRGIDALSIRTEEFKYVYLHNKEDQLYDLRSDPEEKNNIIKLKPDVAERFRKMLPSILAEKNQNRVKTVNLDERTIKELKALGYIQ